MKSSIGFVFTVAFIVISGCAQAQTKDVFLPYQNISTGSRPVAVATGDLNGDRKIDVALVTSYFSDPENDYKLFVFLQGERGELMSAIKYPIERMELYANPYSLAIGDLNGDSRNDVAVGIRGKGIKIFYQNLDRNLDAGELISTGNSSLIKIVDLNHDKRLDLVGIGCDIEAYFQNKHGVLNQSLILENLSEEYNGKDFAVGNIDNGVRSDIVTAERDIYGYVFSINLYYQKKRNNFYLSSVFSVPADSYSYAIAIGDVMGNEKNEIIMICGGNRPSSKVAIFAKRRGLFSEPIIYDSYDCPEAVKVANVTGSEKDDIIVLHAGWHSVGVYSVQENGEMGEEDLYPIPYSSFNRQSMDVGDINGDGKNDVVVTHSNGLAILYHAP